MAAHSPLPPEHVGLPIRQGWAARTVMFHGLACVQAELSPIARNEHITATAMFPSWRDPHRVLTRRNLPSTRFPYIGATVPAVITTDPNVIGTRPRGAMLDSQRRRTDMYHDIGGTDRPDAQCSPQDS